MLKVLELAFFSGIFFFSSDHLRFKIIIFLGPMEVFSFSGTPFVEMMPVLKKTYDNFPLDFSEFIDIIFSRTEGKQTDHLTQTKLHLLTFVSFLFVFHCNLTKLRDLIFDFRIIELQT